MKKHLMLVVGVMLSVISCDPPSPGSSASTSLLVDWPVQNTLNLNLPVNRGMVIIFDSSGSMSERSSMGKDSKITEAKQAIATYIKSLPSDVEVGVVAFSGWENIILSPIQKDHTLVMQKISELSADGGTPLGAATGLAYNMLARWSNGQPGPIEAHLVIVTDGEAGDPRDLDMYVGKILTTPVRIFTIGFDIGEHSLNMPGKTRYVPASNTEQLKRGLEQVLAEKEE